jgi:hypothetical protein
MLGGVWSKAGLGKNTKIFLKNNGSKKGLGYSSGKALA